MKTILIALAVISSFVASAAVAHAKPHCAVPTTAPDAFKEVTGARADAAQAVDGPDGSLVVGAWSAGKRHRVTAAYVIVKGKDRCVGAAIELGDGEAVQIVGRADLDVDGELWTGTAWQLLDAAARPTHPAAVVLITHGAATEVVLLSVPPTAGRLLARAPFSGGGLEAIKVELAGSTTPRDLEVTVTAMPSPGDKSPHPGPPQRRTMHWKNGAYAR